MKLLDSLLDAIVRLEGDALVMHVGEKPYVVTASASMNPYRGPLAWGQVELSSRVLTFDAVTSMLSQILPLDQQQALDEYGAIEHEIAGPPTLTQRFTVIAARGGEDVWVEVRRKAEEVAQPVAAEPPAVEQVAAEPAAAAPPPAAEPVAPVAVAEPPAVEEEVEEEEVQEVQEIQDVENLELPLGLETDDNLDSIVVELPGDLTSDVPLNAVPDHAIELIDDEPQGVPTEAEVDAMLAATASALLTSGLGSDADTIVPDEMLPDEIIPIETIIPIDDGAGNRFDEEAVGEVVRLDVTPASYSAEVAFELSPPSASIAVLELEHEEEYETASPEFSYERPIGTPLFSEEAVLAAAADPDAIDIEAEQALGRVDLTVEPPAEAPSERSTTFGGGEDAKPFYAAEPPPPVEAAEPQSVYASVPVEVLDFSTPPIDVSEQMAVWSSALTEWATAPVQHPDPIESVCRPQVPEPPAPSSPLNNVPSVVETPMEATSEASYQTHGVVVPIARTQESGPAAFTPADDAALMKTLRVAAARGAATVYVVAQSKPMIRVDGEISALDNEPILAAADVERLVTELVPPRKREAVQTGPVEWLCEIPEVGRVRCLTFRDHRGPGVLFHMFPQRAVAGDQINLAPELQALCQQSDGLVLVTGARSNGKSTLLNAFVDLINHTRSDHVITVESQIGFVHQSRRSFVSQRETRGDAELAATFVRTGLREDPDVMVVDDLKSPEAVAAALDAAESGRLVLASITSASTSDAIERLLDMVPAEQRQKARASLANSLRGVVAQVLLRKSKGGRTAAREILVNTAAVAAIVREGDTGQLPATLESGRRHGMVPLTESLAAHVREGTVHGAEAYRHANDREALLGVLRRDGVDTSFAELLG